MLIFCKLIKIRTLTSLLPHSVSSTNTNIKYSLVVYVLMSICAWIAYIEVYPKSRLHLSELLWLPLVRVASLQTYGSEMPWFTVCLKTEENV